MGLYYLILGPYYLILPQSIQLRGKTLISNVDQPAD